MNWNPLKLDPPFKAEEGIIIAVFRYLLSLPKYPIYIIHNLLSLLVKFIVKKANGSKKTIEEWQRIGFVQGSGNSNSNKEYSYIDKNLVGGSKLLYRLKQVDNDGQFEYSDIVEAEVIPTQYELSQNFPNPFNPSTLINFSVPKQTQLRISLYNVLGELVYIIAEGVYETGFYKETINANSLASGTYICRLESKDFIKSRKILLIRQETFIKKIEFLLHFISQNLDIKI